MESIGVRPTIPRPVPHPLDPNGSECGKVAPPPWHFDVHEAEINHQSIYLLLSNATLICWNGQQGEDSLNIFICEGYCNFFF